MKLASDIYEVFEAPAPEGALLAGRKSAADHAFERGRAEGLTEGVLAGRQEGLTEGRAAGFEEGRRQGLEEGRAQALSEAERQQKDALTALARRLETGIAERAEAEARMAADAAAAVHAALGAMLPRLARRGMADEVAALSEELLRDAAHGNAMLRVAPEQEAAAIEALDAYRAAHGAAAEIVFESDPSIGPAEARLEWRDGMAAFDGEAAAARILAHLEGAFAALREPAARGAAADPVDHQAELKGEH